MIFADSTDVSWPQAILAILAFLTFLAKWWRDERLATKNAADRNVKVESQTAELKEAVANTVAAATAPIGADVLVVRKQTNGAMQEVVRAAVAEALAAERAAVAKGGP